MRLPWYYFIPGTNYVLFKTMWKKNKAKSLLVLISVLTGSNLNSENMVASEAKFVLRAKQEISTKRGQQWAANNWTYNKLIYVIGEDTKDPREYGRAVVDREGIDLTSKYDPLGSLFGLIKAPFSGPEPNRVIAISTWKSQRDGCFMELLLQVTLPPEISFTNKRYLERVLIPKKVHVSVDGKRLLPLTQKVGNEKKIGGPYSYSYYNATFDRIFSLGWHQARNEFVIDSKVSKALIDAPLGQARVVFTVELGDEERSYAYLIGKHTSSLWTDVFSRNPDCSPNSPDPQLRPDVLTAYNRMGSLAERPDEEDETKFRYRGEALIAYDRRVGSSLKAEVKLTASERKQRQIFQQPWKKKDPAIANYLGSWYVPGETEEYNRYFYIYPSERKQYACVVIQEFGKYSVNVGYTYKTGNELRYVKGEDPNRALYWRNTPDALAARDSGPGIFYPIYATQKIPELPPEIRSQLEKSSCSATLTASASQNLTPISKQLE